MLRTPWSRNGPPFADRRDAGQQLGAAIAKLGLSNPVVLGLPRGGVPVAAEVATRLGAPLDVILVRKLGLPDWPEVAMGAIGEGGVRVVDEQLIARVRVSPAQLASVEQREQKTLQLRAALLRKNRLSPDLSGRTALIVDDGIATGTTASAACRVARNFGAERVIVAAPVGGPDARRQVHGADEVLCLIQPPDFSAVAPYYADFRQTEDDEVDALLEHRRKGTSS
ncbi:MAG: putative phosphoribosyl transferase [Actinomycetota bacterium]|nr:putative phosphoribosyl transferase [Actinomycetota bacterium]